MDRIPATVGILTFNSGSTLRRALESVRDFEEVVVCDGDSTDDTLDIAREFGAKVVMQDGAYKNADGTLKDYGGVRNQLLSAASHDWFLYIDSDETISDGLREEIRQAVTHSTGALVYRVPIGIMMDGRYLKHSSNYPGYQTRFFNKRSGARFIRPVHERIEFGDDIKVGTFKHPWYVHTTREFWNTYAQSRGTRYRTGEVERACKAPLGEYLYTTFWHLRVALAVVAKSAWIYARYGFKDSVPPRGELGRALVPLMHVWRVTLCRFLG